MLTNTKEWKSLSSLEKKEKLLSAYIANLEKEFKRTYQPELQSRIRESKFILELFRERNVA